MKKFFSILLIFLTIITVTGCKRIIILKTDEPTIINHKKIGAFAKNMNLTFDDVKFKQRLDETLDIISDAKDYYDIDEALRKIISSITELTRKYTVADCLTNYDPNNSEYTEKFNALQDAYYEYEKFYNKMIVEISRDDEFLSQFYAGYDQESIDFEVELAKKKQDENYIALEKELDDIKNEANKIGINIYSDVMDDELLELMFEYVKKNKQLASLLGFDSYIEYADINYSRSYLQSDVDDFIDYTKQYLVPLLDESGYFVDALALYNNLSIGQKNYFQEFSYSSIYDKDYKTINLLNDYAKEMSGSYLNSFKNYINTGNFIFADKDDSIEGAYTSKYISYYGPGYQDCTTVAHEFGHFYSFTNDLLNTKSLDLKEFYSQANEFLFTNYLERNSRNNVKAVYDVNAKIKIGDACRTIVISSALREFEQKLYTTTLTDKSDILTIWNNLNNNSYNGTLQAFWKAEIRYDLYYLSYGTSVTGALGLYSASKDRFSDAKYKYFLAVQNDSINDDIVEVLEHAGLSSPFDEKVFIEIANLIKEV